MKKIVSAAATVLFTGVLTMSFIKAGGSEVMDKTESKLEKATFAGGCFWCMQPPYAKLKGVASTRVGYTGGSAKNPAYEEVSSGRTGHAEAVEIHYDPNLISYEELLDTFWRNIDPTAKNRQFADSGTQYRTAIFYHNERQKLLAYKSKEMLEKSGKFKDPVVTEIAPASDFFPAEDYHQDYYKKNPMRYELYKTGSGREEYINKTWVDKGSISNGKDASDRDYSKPAKEDLKKKLTPLQYEVTQGNATERPFGNEYWNNHKEGIYVDVVSGEPLFSSTDKFDSGSGWPSFMRPIEPLNIVEKEDSSHSMKRTEVRSKGGDSHLGHLFDDGPGPTGQRYCINSASLRFVSKEDLEKEGYGKYKYLFE